MLLRLGYNLSYTPLVKTAISIPDEVYEAAEKLADELKMSRSELYARAVAEYVAERRDEDITRRLDEVYGELENEPDPVLNELQFQTLARNEW